MELHVDRKQIDKVIKGMNLFKETKQVLTQYKNAVKVLEEREQNLNEEAEKLQEKHTKLFLDQQEITDVSEIIYMRKQGEDISDDLRVIEFLLEEVGEEIKTLQISYAPLFQQALLNDRKETHKYKVKPMVDSVRYELLKAIADISQAMSDQYSEISHEIGPVLGNSDVRAAYPRIGYLVDSDNFLPPYGEVMPNILTKNDIFAARSKQINYPNPNEIK